MSHTEARADVLASMVEQYSTTLYRIAYSVTRNSAEAEDAVQDTFLRVLRHRDKLDEIRDARVWLIRITWNIVLDGKRRKKTRPENDDIEEFVRLLPSKELSAHERAQAAQQHSRVMNLIHTLPAKEREVLLLSAFDELTTVETAQVLKISESAVRSRLFRARQQMMILLKNLPDNPLDGGSR